MPKIPIDIPPGINPIPDSTELSSMSWVNGDKVRFYNGKLEKIGGWVKSKLNGKIEGSPRSLFSVRDNNNLWLIIATNTDLYTLTGAELSNIIPAGLKEGPSDAYLGHGYGMNKYGEGKFGAVKTSINLLIEPRIWSVARFGDDVVMAPGDKSPLYIWQGNPKILPNIIPNSPKECNYVFTLSDMVVALGAYSDVDEDTRDNRIRWSDIGKSGQWHAAIDNKAGEIVLRGANKLISHAEIIGGALIFAKNQTWIMRHIGGDYVWSFDLIDSSVGCIGQNARISVNGVAYWMGEDNFYKYEGGYVTPISGGNIINPIKKYVFKNINKSQKTKSFAWYNAKFEELWFHYPSADSLEPNLYVIYSLREGHWTIGSLNRSAAEFPSILSEYPRLVDEEGHLYKHENGVDADDEPLKSYAETNYAQIGEGDYTMEVQGVIPDSLQEGEINLTIYTKLYPQGNEIITGPIVATSKTEHLDFFAVGRQRKYLIESDEIGSYFRLGKWSEEVIRGTKD